MQHIILALTLGFAATLNLATTISASVILDNGPPVFGNRAGPIGNDGIPGFDGPLGPATADDFVLATTSWVDDVVFWSVDRPETPWAGRLDYLIFAHDGTGPAAMPLEFERAINVTRAATGNSAGIDPGDEYRWQFSLQRPFLAEAGVRYWLALNVRFEHATGPGPQGIFWEATRTNRFGFSTHRIYIYLDTPPFAWVNLRPDKDAAFQLLGHTAIPEPSTIATWSLMGFVGVCFGWYRRRAG